MFFQAYIKRNKRHSDNCRLLCNLMDSNHDFPRFSREKTFHRYFEEKNLSEHYVKVFDEAWSDFISQSYAKLHTYRNKTNG